jgi:hypothetical protein
LAARPGAALAEALGVALAALLAAVDGAGALPARELAVAWADPGRMAATAPAVTTPGHGGAEFCPAVVH